MDIVPEIAAATTQLIEDEARAWIRENYPYIESEKRACFSFLQMETAFLAGAAAGFEKATAMFRAI